MKKTIILFAAAAALSLVAISCNKAESPDDNTPVQVNITIADLTPSTKAVKTGWTNGDVINVYVNSFYGYRDPDFTLTYDGSKWVSSTISSEVEAKLDATGSSLYGFWEATNSCAASSDWSKADVYYIYYPKFYGFDGTTGGATYLTAYFNNIPYEYSGGKLTANINAWTFQTNFQLVVTGLTYEEDRYMLYAESDANVKCVRYISLFGNFEMDPEYDRNIAGLPNADGVAFVGNLGSDGVEADYTFRIKDNVDNKIYTFTKTGVTLSSSSNTKVAAVKIPFSKFTEE